MEPNIPLDDKSVQPTFPQNRSPRSAESSQETPCRVRTLSRSLRMSQTSLTRALSDSVETQWTGIKAPDAAAPTMPGGDGQVDTSSCDDSEVSSPNLATSDKLYVTEEQILSRMKVLRKRYSESLVQVRRLRRSLGSLSPSPEPSNEGNSACKQSRQPAVDHHAVDSHTADGDLDDTESHRRTFLGSGTTVYAEEVAQAQGVPTTALFSTKPLPEEIIVDEHGYKSYRCLLCQRTFTHPPAFSQHKRAHGREAAKI